MERRLPSERQVLSINLARPHTFLWQGRQVQTGIFKEPVSGRVAVHTLGLAGDMQADLRVHGGRRKAVYVYPLEHYEFWKSELSIRELPPGSFGENLTTTGLLETEAHAGDHLRIGTAVFEVTQPRSPCFKLALKFQRPDMIQRFLASGRSGFYLSVVHEGDIERGMSIEMMAGLSRGASVIEMYREYQLKKAK